MKLKIFLLSLSIILFGQCDKKASFEKPPLAKVQVVEEEYFGKKVTDPYRYMENLNNPEVIKWFKAQSKYARSVLDAIPGRQSLIKKMREFDKRKSSRIYNVRITENNRYFYLKTTPDDEIGKLYYRNGYEGKEIFLYDPQTYSDDTSKTFVIDNLAPFHDGSKIAFEVSPNGSESSTLLIMDVEHKKLFPERIDRCWFPILGWVWLPDGERLFYTRLQSNDVHDKNRLKNCKVYLHKIGTDPVHDIEFFSRAKYSDSGIQPEELPFVFYNKDNRYLFALALTVDQSIKMYYAPGSELKNKKINWNTLFKKEDKVNWFNLTDKDIYFYTFKNAPHFKLLKTSLKNPDLEKAEVVIPEPAEETLTGFSLSKHGIYYTLNKNGIEEKLFFLPYGKKNGEEIKLPFAAGRIILHTKGFKFGDVWVTINGWTHDYQRYRYLRKSHQFKLENLSDVAEYPEYADLTSREVMVSSHDGVKVPLSLIYKKGLVKNNQNRVLIFGYGAYGVPIKPFFSPNFNLWIHEGGLLAVAHVRGGGELGEKWHKAGFKTTKHNTWKDLIACTEYLINQGYTSKPYIAIYSSSAGGILIGRAMTERPDLFAVAIPDVGFLNPLRGEESPNGPVNVPEFGTVKDSTECMALMEMDSYLHLKESVKYPATFITAGMNDPRVIVWQPAKFAARLQAVNASNKPILFYVDFKAGHGYGNTKSKNFESLADVLSFALWQTGHPKYQLTLR